MAKTKPEIEVNLEQVERLAAQGMTMEQIAYSLGIGESTLYAKKAKNKEIAEAIKKGKAKGIAKITNALFENASKGNLGAQCFFLKNQAGWTDRPEYRDEPIKPIAIKVISDD